jgi:hypothetical protein
MRLFFSHFEKVSKKRQRLQPRLIYCRKMGIVEAEFKHADYWWMLISGAKDVTCNVNYKNEYFNFLRNIAVK